MQVDVDTRTAHQDGQEEPPRGGVEEAHRLLETGKEMSDDEVNFKSQGGRRRRNCHSWLLIAGAALVPLLLVVAFLLYGTGATNAPHGETAIPTHEDIPTPHETTRPEPKPTPRVQSNDYLLDPNWDVDGAPGRREYWWTVRDHEHNPDGIYRPMMLINNQFPGPLIEVNEGDTVVVHVDNQATNATSIHWHGIYQIGTPHMDGTVGVTQCAIAPGTDFTYEFTISGQSGTYWWHAHQGLQSADGLHGPLIVHSRRERELQKLPYDTDRVILVSDHYHDLSSALLWQYMKPDMENAEPVPAGAVINGRAIRNCANFPDRRCDNTSAHVQVPKFDLEAGQSHRLRFINVAMLAEFEIQIDEHELAVTEVDGTDVIPASYHRIHVSTAQRYSVVVHANHTDATNFWLRARMMKHCFTDPPRNLEAEIWAHVSYGSDLSTPASMNWDDMIWLQCKDMDTTELVPVETIAAPAQADDFFYIRANFEIGAYRLSRGFFNRSSWRPNAFSPVLSRAIEGLSTSNDTFFPSTPEDQFAHVNNQAFDATHELVIQSPGPRTIDLLIHNFEDKTHPLHLHGYKFFVLASGHGYPNLTYTGAEINPTNLAPLYNSIDLSNPLRRDTASVMGYSWILLRVVADNPGVWAFHCHIAWHSEAGLMMLLLTNSDALVGIELPESHSGLCSREGVERGLGPEDESYRAIAR